MGALIATRKRRLLWTLLAFILVMALALWLVWRADMAAPQLQPLHSIGDLMTRLLAIPALSAFSVLMLLTACVAGPTAVPASASANPGISAPVKPFMAQVVGVQWLNPLQRRDYPAEWQLLWTLGLAKPNKDDDMVIAKPKKYSKLQSIGMVASSNDGKETFEGFHEKYIRKITSISRSNYFADPEYFYNVHSRDKTKWRELAGIHIEYALPADKLDPLEAGDYTAKRIADIFEIGNPNDSTFWTRATPPDVHVTMGGANAGFTSLSAALDYLQAHPKESAWVMNWDAPNFPKDEEINENLVLLVLAGPDFKTERAALAHIGYPASKAVADFEAQKGGPPRAVQAWKATFEAATHNAGKLDTDIGYVIYDANKSDPDSSDRIGKLAHTLSTELIEFDFMKQTFNTPALLGEMGAGTALTNVALGIAYANHAGKNVLVAGTTDAALPTAVLVVPPAQVRPVNHDARWFRARGENNAYLFWWGIRHDAEPRAQMQGYSQ
jgi:hypothetical protein